MMPDPLRLDVPMVSDKGEPLPSFQRWWETIRAGQPTTPPLNEGQPVVDQQGFATTTLAGAWRALELDTGNLVPPLPGYIQIASMSYPTFEFQRLADAVNRRFPFP